ncbi:MAG: DUF2267 domain-containing protein [Myxococcales bacterium]
MHLEPLPRRTGRAEPFRSFLRELRAGEPISESAAARTAAAVLCALDVQLAGSAGALTNLLRSCPLHLADAPRKIDRDAVIATVAEETGTTRNEARRLVRRVLDGVRARVPPEEAAEIAARLGGLAELWATR